MKVYLAGPDVFLPDAKAYGEALKAKCAAAGLVGVFPLDAGLDLSGLSKKDAADKIYQANLAQIADCDAVLANMTPFRGVNMDTGTAFEMGYGLGLGKRVVGYTADPSKYLDRVKANLLVIQDVDGQTWDADGLLVEDFDVPDNLMMVCAVEAVFGSFDEAVGYLKAER
ncbi:nucleoside 2-deoxyribosyltransferase [Magnetovibrio sp. PR-2]|uniref:nucleoside 2-deoxyribosyltransferase n=1 Tax=Magnetovibrio sp. PR-2 TaxID=3120356 RepID=UPI002FCDF2B9